MKRARILHKGLAQWASAAENDCQLLLADGTKIAAEDAIWLPPVIPGASVFALGLNFADHTRELGFKPPEQPLVFLKGHRTFVANNGETPYPPDAEQIHPECELVAVIGKTARNVSEADALSFVGGYTLACDYAVREYLENYYRPNLKVKNRDATTPIGPWLVDAADVDNPQALGMKTTVNGETVQHGSTSDMVFSIAWLVSWLSNFMTLRPGDLILTGTPHGVHFCKPGDKVVCEIEQIGKLTNTLGAQE
ncbi:fumarylacetoacetate hydrolase family protein [uncultured Hyphomonas sp.]|uniref:fumarylacetoacetate hydrolase family protein n=1 Tax=uncultured Hyphomonas sp. TaxID=225298 RepID=UPI002AAA7708|nr:fumarylacetoacetate hydrolase family protein [uncultured Hyphomonas sp.]